MLQKLTKMKNQKGFTLVELMVVVAILGVLVAIAIPVYNTVTFSAQQKSHNANVRTLEGAVEVYAADHPTILRTDMDVITVLASVYIKEVPVNPLPTGTVVGTVTYSGAYTMTDGVISPTYIPTP